jgi:transposase-like protein
MDPIKAAITAIESQEPGASFSYRKIAKEYGVALSTLTRRHQGVTQARADTDSTRRNLSPQQELELLRYIRGLTKRGLPPTRQMIQSFASTIAKKEVSLSWVDRFVRRHPESLISRWTTGIDSNRHKADSLGKYEDYFQLLQQKIGQYQIETQHIYNMDEKGCLLGITSRSKRIFDRPLYESKVVRQAI